jgi:hypothetical protein
MLYSKNGSIPKPETDGTEGWIEVADAPEAPEGKEVVWWYPPGWVIRDPKPEGNWSWSQSQEQWVEIVQVTEQTITSESIFSLDSSDISSLTSSQISGLNG